MGNFGLNNRLFQSPRKSVAGKGSIVIYQTPEGKAELEVKLEHETPWLHQYPLAELFETDRTSILRHIRNI